MDDNGPNSKLDDKGDDGILQEAARGWLPTMSTPELSQVQAPLFGGRRIILQVFLGLFLTKPPPERQPNAVKPLFADTLPPTSPSRFAIRVLFPGGREGEFCHLLIHDFLSLVWRDMVGDPISSEVTGGAKDDGADSSSHKGSRTGFDTK
jgi:hypothetical protein